MKRKEKESSDDGMFFVDSDIEQTRKKQTTKLSTFHPTPEEQNPTPAPLHLRCNKRVKTTAARLENVKNIDGHMIKRKRRKYRVNTTTATTTTKATGKRYFVKNPKGRIIFTIDE